MSTDKKAPGPTASPKTTIRLEVELDTTEQWYLVTQAMYRGFKRAEPYKAWKESERREAIRFILDIYVKEVLCERTPHK